MVTKIVDFLCLQDGGTKIVSFTVLGPIFAQERPRIRHNDLPRPRFYDPSANRKALWKKILKKELLAFGEDPTSPFRNGSIKAVLTFVGSNVNHMDIDNLVKFVLDAFQGVLFENDRIVNKLVAQKMAPNGASSWVECSFEMVQDVPRNPAI